MKTKTGDPFKLGEVVTVSPGRFLAFNPDNNEIGGFGELIPVKATETAEKTEMEVIEETVTEQVMTKSGDD